MRAPVSSSRITGSSGDLVRRMNPNHPTRARADLDWRSAVRSAVASRTAATSSTTMGTHCQEVIGWGSRIFSHASYRANNPPRVNSTIATRKA
jgi:hypothetical protein